MKIPELLVPVGGPQQLRAAIANGADAVYMSGNAFNARLNADNFSDNELANAIYLAHEYGVRVHITQNTLIKTEEMEAALKGKLEPEYEEKVLGEAEVRKLFKFSKVGTIAGSYVTSGVIKRGAKARVIRDGVVVIDSTIGSLAREKDQAKEVKQGLECGITIENFNDIKEKDIIEAYELVEIKR